MAAIVTGYSTSLSNNKFLKDNKKKVMPRRKPAFVSASTATTTLTDPYQTLRINFGASESEVKKAFRRLALRACLYHPDVCREDNCTMKFHQINEAYDTVMNKLREEKEARLEKYYEEDLWEEWMGWEGAGIRDYTSHVNPYV